MPKNYYIILGIPSDSTHDDIKSAYRRLAKEYHPDYYGESRIPFLAIQEAYSVLSDPLQRKQYDKSLNKLRVSSKGRQPEEAWQSFSQTDAEPLSPVHDRAEPLTPETTSAPRGMAPGVDSFFSEFFSTASQNWKYDGGRREYEDMEVLLTAEQARQGGHVRVILPVQMRCPDCRGWSSSGLQDCWRCFGRGYLKGEIPVFLNYPAGVPQNHLVTIPLSRYGFSGNSLKVRFKVADAFR